MHLLFLMFLIPDIMAGRVYGDVGLYRQWAFAGIKEGVWQGIDVPWVYPIGAMLPMLAAGLLGQKLYMLGWFLLCTVLNLLALFVLKRSRSLPFGWQAAYLWVLLIGILGPLVFSRVDGVSAPLVVIGLVFAAERPAIASALLSVATWVKVWPAAVVLSLLLATKARLQVLLAGAAVSAVMIGSVVAGGGASNLLGFVKAQGERGMQLEAPFTTPGLWQAVLGWGAWVHPNFELTTLEIRGTLSDFVGTLMNPLLCVSLLLIGLLILAGVRTRVDRQELMMMGALALVSAMIVFNKVGSPQFMIWLAAVICVGSALYGLRWAVPAIAMFVIGILTTLVFPILYVQLYVALNPGVALLLTLRNALVIMVFGWSLMKLWGIVRFKNSEDRSDARVSVHD
ncbi:uncharacterized protein DUF2029 [Arthrobacter sp. SLBN-112]|uniref:glycosyltransferase 87 family protein n=1 Tax=Arthrobacter sp. SLBN-112 TaxID=2768452 RepID=UPI00114F0ACA|nr:glycosyltransferase 87 family protein [Arthrobacter sp. SLBN-112]TQJ38821.1 uncharacterized protein DUF2029 [Arthrobacter sp. SLBN-112]